MDPDGSTEGVLEVSLEKKSQEVGNASAREQGEVLEQPLASESASKHMTSGEGHGAKVDMTDEVIEMQVPSDLPETTSPIPPKRMIHSVAGGGDVSQDIVEIMSSLDFPNGAIPGVEASSHETVTLPGGVVVEKRIEEAVRDVRQRVGLEETALVVEPLPIPGSEALKNHKESLEDIEMEMAQRGVKREDEKMEEMDAFATSPTLIHVGSGGDAEDSKPSLVKHVPENEQGAAHARDIPNEIPLVAEESVSSATQSLPVSKSFTPAASEGSDESSDESESESDTSSSSSSSEDDLEILRARTRAREPAREGNGLANPKQNQRRRHSDASSSSSGEAQAPRTVHELVDPTPSNVPTEQIIPDTRRIERFAKLKSLIGDVVVLEGDSIKALHGGMTWEGRSKVLDEGSLVCFEDRQVIGYIFETFGPTAGPLYTVRLTFAPRDAESKAKYKEGSDVFFVPDQAEYVFEDEVRQLGKGTDASNLYDEEVGEHEIEFSDDEKEAEWKRSKKKGKGTYNEEEGGSRGRNARRGRGRGRGQASRSTSVSSSAPLPHWYNDTPSNSSETAYEEGEYIIPERPPRGQMLPPRRGMPLARGGGGSWTSSPNFESNGAGRYENGFVAPSPSRGARGRARPFRSRGRGGSESIRQELHPPPQQHIGASPQPFSPQPGFQQGMPAFPGCNPMMGNGWQAPWGMPFMGFNMGAGFGPPQQQPPPSMEQPSYHNHSGGDEGYDPTSPSSNMPSRGQCNPSSSFQFGASPMLNPNFGFQFGGTHGFPPS